MQYFNAFLESTNHLPYVVSSYTIVFFLLIGIFTLSFKRVKKLEKSFNHLTKNES